jgi:hypothetical protein
MSPSATPARPGYLQLDTLDFLTYWLNLPFPAIFKALGLPSGIKPPGNLFFCYRVVLRLSM